MLTAAEIKQLMGAAGNLDEESAQENGAQDEQGATARGEKAKT